MALSARCPQVASVPPNFTTGFAWASITKQERLQLHRAGAENK